MDATSRLEGRAGTSAAVAFPDADEEVTRSVLVIGMIGIALVHLLDLPGTIEDAPALAWAFGGVIVTSLILAEYLRRTGSTLAWLLCGGLAAAVLLGYVLSRTIGIPGLTTEDVGNWGEPLGIASVVIEAAVVWLAGTTFAGRVTS